MALWVYFALGSAFFAGLTAIFGKVGVTGIPSNLATFLRTIVVLVFSGGIVFSLEEWQNPDLFGFIGSGNRGFLVMLLPGSSTWTHLQSGPR